MSTEGFNDRLIEDRPDTAAGAFGDSNRKGTKRTTDRPQNDDFVSSYRNQFGEGRLQKTERFMEEFRAVIGQTM